MNKRKRQIIHAARQLFIDKGFNDTSIIDIISTANVSKGTFYNHFGSKNECLIAILEETREETVSSRYEMALNQDPSDKDILIKQIAILTHVNRKRNLVQIFESLVGNTDIELKKALEKHMIAELNWLASRLIDVYGEGVRDISYECAVQALGMIQQSLRVLTMARSKQPATPEEVVQVVMNHVDAIIERQLKSQHILITPEVIQALQLKIKQKAIHKEALLEQLQGFLDRLTPEDPESGIEYTKYLLKELNSENEHIHILHAILSAFNKSFRGTSHEAEAHEISITIWRYLHMKKEMKK
ncbi:TetR/AcrR family transcriptional regulator [Ureibacillus sp. Re31]|uniref:TetR/AcrR family transcriptional regulator n=1 Tax=Ureibacillus galli TaxID=2762222 RepID=A0ABR8XAQ6_9BACL|nr:TetR/AcrR family transcriptional regulator [Ureibacillus galli]MBD8026395.1 TetR/AcrR family transcriptional regulator [Ureibacillus galli]